MLTSTYSGDVDTFVELVKPAVRGDILRDQGDEFAEDFWSALREEVQDRISGKRPPLSAAVHVGIGHG